MEILKNQTLEMKNVLSYRGKVTQQEFALKSQEIQTIIEKSSAAKDGNIATTTYAVEQTESGQVMDVEIPRCFRTQQMNLIIILFRTDWFRLP